MNCLDLEILGAHLEGRLGKADAERVRVHAADCELCREMLAIGAVVDLAEEGDAQVPQRIMATVIGSAEPEAPTRSPSSRTMKPGRRQSRRRRRRVRSPSGSSSSALVAAALLAVVGLAYLAIPSQTPAPTHGTQASPLVLATVMNQAQDARLIRGIHGEPLMKGAEIQAGDTIRGGNTRAEIRLTDGSTIDLAPDAIVRFSVNATNPRQSLAYVAGDVYLSVARGKGRFAVDVKGGRVTVLGTEFLLRSRRDQSTLIAVAEGRVSAQNDRGQVEIAADQQSSISQGIAPTRPESANVGALTAWRRLPPSYAPPVIFSSNFEDGTSGGLGGRVVPGGASPDSKFCLAAVRREIYWVVFGSSYYGMDKPWIAGRTEIRFKFKADRGPVKIKAMSRDHRPGDHWVRYFDVKPGQWTEVVLRGDELHDERGGNNRTYLSADARMDGFHFLVGQHNSDDDVGFRLDDLTIREIED